MKTKFLDDIIKILISIMFIIVFYMIEINKLLKYRRLKQSKQNKEMNL